MTKLLITDIAGGTFYGCECVRDWWPLVQRMALKRGLIKQKLDVMQGCYSGGRVAASASTHNGGGVLDIAQTSQAVNDLLEQAGAAAFVRSPEDGMVWHCHMILIGCPHLDGVPTQGRTRVTSAAKQVEDWKRGLNGLANNARDRDQTRPNPIRSWSQGLTWMQSQLGNVPLAPASVPGGVADGSSVVHGIDISNWQAGIDLGAITYGRLGLKVTEGRGYVDPEWRASLAKHRAAKPGVPVLPYHYVSQGNTPADEATNFVARWREGGFSGADVPVLDWEPKGTSPAPSNVEWAAQWLAAVEAALGVKPWIYMNLSTANTHASQWEAAGVTRHLLWLAHYVGSNTSTGYVPDGRRGDLDSRWKLAGWQFTDGGRLPGYQGNLDLNQFYAPTLSPASSGLPLPGTGVSDDQEDPIMTAALEAKLDRLIEISSENQRRMGWLAKDKTLSEQIEAITITISDEDAARIGAAVAAALLAALRGVATELPGPTSGE